MLETRWHSRYNIRVLRFVIWGDCIAANPKGIVEWKIEYRPRHLPLLSVWILLCSNSAFLSVVQHCYRSCWFLWYGDLTDMYNLECLDKVNGHFVLFSGLLTPYWIWRWVHKWILFFHVWGMWWILAFLQSHEILPCLPFFCWYTLCLRLSACQQKLHFQRTLCWISMRNFHRYWIRGCHSVLYYIRVGDWGNYLVNRSIGFLMESF